MWSHSTLSLLSAQNRRLYFIIDVPTRRRFHRIRVRNKTIEECFKLLLEILKKPVVGLLVREVEMNNSTFTNCDPSELGIEDEGDEFSLLIRTIRAAGFNCERGEDIMMAEEKLALEIEQPSTSVLSWACCYWPPVQTSQY
ncbi:hypothetical protein GX50_01094 [[Emmonsia] crescens]|uniref:Uncharacterized protein n=1 Tax=[Emmonsia] crescens TaxID=73230 RepID=A0A2B7ZSU6_9EURO|nr:hypothetical protein GX50_01094 [Emmonsia crescens]